MERPRCAHCHDILGTYEPIRVLLGNGDQLRGPLPTLREALQAPGATAIHERCYADYEPAPTDPPDPPAN